MRQALAVILFTDIVGSLDLKRVHGQDEAARLIVRHDGLFREAVEASEGGRVLKDTGDGFLATFGRPSDAVRSALSFQRALATDGELAGAVSSRIGIHLGEIGSVESAVEDEKTMGLAVDLAARLMGMADGGQILMTRPVFDDARAFVREHPETEGDLPTLDWLAHGPYILQGMEGTIEVFEVGAVGTAPLTEPADSGKARRAVRPGDEETLGWRPASGLEIPGREAWRLEEKLGEGGFGEVWTARNESTREVRTFKFCFEAEQVRSLKREMTLFRLLRETLGERPDIARLYDVRLDAPPYFLEMDYTPAGDVTRWAAARGGIAAVGLEVRLALVAQVADALAAAHSVGVLHKDVKPVNVLVAEDTDGKPMARLTDFGIGRLVQHDALAQAGITDSGFTVGGPTLFGEDTSSSGTRMYMAPELDAGASPSVQSDVFSLGVFLLQMILADFRRPLGMGWERDVKDPLLRDDVARCVDGDPARRLASAAILAERLRGLEERAEEERREKERLLAEKRAIAEAARAKRARRLGWIAGFVGAGVILAATWVAYRERERAEGQALLRAAAEDSLYLSTVRHASSAMAAGGFAAAETALLGTAPGRRGWEWGYLMRRAHSELISLSGHFGGVRRVQFDAAGEFVLTGSADGTARVWDAATGSQTLVLRGHAGSLSAARFQPGGNWILTASSDGTARIWDGAGGSVLQELAAHLGPVHHAAWSPDGQLAVTSSADGTAKVWDAATGAELATLAGHENAVATSLAGSRRGVLFAQFSPDSSMVATAATDATAAVWDARSGARVLVLSGHGAYLRSARFSPDGTLLATASQDGTARIWEVATGRAVSVMKGHVQEVYDAVFGPEGRLLATAGDDGTARIWEVDSGRQLTVLVGHTKWVRRAWWLGPGRVVTASGDATARIWDADTGVEVARFAGHSYYLEEVAVSPGGRRVATASRDGQAKIWDAATGREPILIPAHDLWVWSVAWSPDGARVASASGDGTAKVWDPDTGALVATLEGHGGEVRDARFSPDGSRLVTTSTDGTARLWDAGTWAETGLLEGHTSVVLMARFSPDGARIATASGDGTARIWDVDSGATLLVRPSGGYPVHTVAWHPTEDLILAGLADGSFAVWEGGTGFERVRVDARGGPLWAAEWSPGGERIATGSDDGRARVWDADTHRLLATMAGHLDVVRAVAWDPAGARLATGSRDGAARLWDASTGEELLQFRNHDLWVRGVGFSPDGEALATASGDATIGIWRAFPAYAGDRPEDWAGWLATWQAARYSRWRELQVVDRGALPATFLVR